MSLDKVRRILEAIRVIASRGEHFQWCGLTHISSVAGLNRQTVWRYLKAMEEQKFVYKVKKTWRGETAYRYYMTTKGKNLLESFWELPLESVTK